MFVTFFNRSYVLNSANYRVNTISVLNNYNGKSKEGIGVHSLRSQVRKKLGMPDLIQPEYNLEQYYFICQDTLKNAATFMYDENQSVRSIGVDTRKR